MTDALLVLAGILITVTVSASIEYYRQLRKVSNEYREAKEVVSDIILSFNRQIKRENEKIGRLRCKLDVTTSRSVEALRKVKEIGGEVKNLNPKARLIQKDKKEIQKKLEEIEEKIRDAVTSQKKLEEIEEKIRDAVTSQKKLEGKLSRMEKGTKAGDEPSEIKLDAVIPIKREKALAPLTKTELTVLEILDSEGTKTAPQIRDRIELSREHTARLMKKLYEEGYLERDTNTIPFKYWIKEEMKKILKKAEVGT